MPQKPFSIAVIGAGPAGLAAAEILASAGHSVTVYERMPSPARKFLLAGRGGLNLTHSEELQTFITRYGNAAESLRPAIERFPPSALGRWAEALGQKTFVGSSGRIFPASFKATPLLRAWLARLNALGVRFAFRHEWTGWNNRTQPVFKTPDGEKIIEADATLLALGGASWPRLGSNGVWASILAEGLEIAPLKPANVGFLKPWSEYFLERFEGTPLKRIAIRFEERQVRSEAVITRTGIEGGAVYAIGNGIRDAILRDGTATIHIDLRPDLPEQVLAKRLAGDRNHQSLSTFLRKAAGLAPVGIALLREVAGKDVPASPDELARLLKDLPLVLTGIAPIERAISTAGGLSFSELDETFMLKKMPGIFAAGEMLDWEAPTGGYLLQACFSTGIAAAHGIISFLENRT